MEDEDEDHHSVLFTEATEGQDLGAQDDLAEVMDGQNGDCAGVVIEAGQEVRVRVKSMFQNLKRPIFSKE